MLMTTAILTEGKNLIVFISTHMNTANIHERLIINCLIFLTVLTKYCQWREI